MRFMKAAVRDTWRTRYGLIVLDPPPSFGRNRKQSEWEFDATKDFGKLLGLTLRLLDGKGSWILAGFVSLASILATIFSSLLLPHSCLGCLFL